MRVDTGSGADVGVAWNPAPRADPGAAPGVRSRSLSGRVVLGLGRWSGVGGVVEVRGPAACMRRDALFRRLLVVADVVAIVGAFLLTVGLSRRSVGLTWAAVAGVPVLVVCAKLTGLYDRDETLLRKTTLDEAPKLFQLATLCALVAWLTGGLITHRPLDRHEVLFLSLALAGGLLRARAVSGGVALRIAPSERCLFIGDEVSGETIRSKLSGHGGVKAEVVAHLDLDKVGAWSTDSFSEARLAEIRDLTRTLDVHRAIIAPRSVDGGEMLNLGGILRAGGVRVSVLPLLLEVVGSSVEFDDLHGVTVMGVRRFELTRSSALVKRLFDIVCASVALFAVAPLMVIAAVLIKLDSRGPVFFRQQRIGRFGRPFSILKFRTMVDDADELKDSLRGKNGVLGVMFKIGADPRITRSGKLLRKTALDELPQLLNILKGEMSMVGPRPLV